MISQPLGSVAKVIAGQSPPSSTYNSVGDGLPFFQGKADFQEMYPKVRIWSNSIQRKEAEPGDILISVRAPVGAVNICNQKSIIGRGLSAIRPKSSLNGKFLYYYLKANEKRIDALGTGSTFKAITQDTLQKILIPLPSLDDQRRIAYLLGKVEGAIAQRKQHLQQLDDLLKSIFLEMFGNPVRNEKGWDSNELEALCEEVIDCPHSTPIYSDEKTGFYCVRSGDIIDGYLDLCNTLPVELSVYEERIKRYRPQKGDIVYSREGGRLGNAARILGEEKICLGQRIMLFKTNAQNESDFLWALLESTAFKAKLQGLVGGGAAPRVNIKDLKKIVVIQPPLNSQIIFSNIVQRVDRIRLGYQQSLSDLENLYGALSQKAFKGELDLSRVPLTSGDTEAPAEENPETNESPRTTDAFELPAPSNLATLKSVEGRNSLLDQWLTVWLERLNNAPFTTQPFMETAQQRLSELAEDDALEWEWGASEYDQIKAWMFESLAKGNLAQTYDNTNNRVQLKAVSK